MRAITLFYMDPCDARVTERSDSGSSGWREEKLIAGQLKISEYLLLGRTKMQHANAMARHRLWLDAEIRRKENYRDRNHVNGARQLLVGPLAAHSPGLGLARAFDVQSLEIERYGGANEILQTRFIYLLAFVDVDGATDISVEAGIE